MKITLSVPSGVIAGFFSGVMCTDNGLQIFNWSLGTDDIYDGNEIKLPRNKEVEDAAD